MRKVLPRQLKLRHVVSGTGNNRLSEANHELWVTRIDHYQLLVAELSFRELLLRQMNIGELEPAVLVSHVHLKVLVEDFYGLWQVVVVLVQTHQTLDAGRVGRACLDELIVNLLCLDDGA